MNEKNIIFNGPRDPHGYGQEVPPVTQVGPITIGFVEEIHGEQGRPVPEYLPTKHELTILAAHWAKQVIKIEQGWAETEAVGCKSVGSDEIRIRLYALDRLAKIADLIGAEAVRAALESRMPPPPAGDNGLDAGEEEPPF